MYKLLVKMIYIIHYYHIVLLIVITIGESFQDYAWIQGFGADFPYNSGFWGWLSIGSQPQNPELGRL